MPELHLDLETRSLRDLKNCGVYPYAECPSTRVLCASFAIDDGPVKTWKPGDPVPAEIIQAVAEDWPIFAHNNSFERALWRGVLTPRHGWPVPKLENMRCTAAMAAAMALPRDLARAAQVTGQPAQKDDEGKKVMLKMCKPRKLAYSSDELQKLHGKNPAILRQIDNGGDPVNERYELVGGGVVGVTWWHTPELEARLIAYCEIDVAVEQGLTKKLRPLSDAEQRVYELDQIINDRGISLDLDLVNTARALADLALDRLNKALSEATGGRVERATKAADLKAWLNENGADVEGVAKDDIRHLLASTDLDEVVYRVAAIRQEAAKASTKKLVKMLSSVCEDARIRGMLLYHGAGTGRWTGRLVQVQNLPRGTVKKIEKAIDLILDASIPLEEKHDLLELLFGAVMEVVSSLLRSCLVAAEGCDLIAADFSNIEGRVIAWLAGEDWKLDAFRAYDTFLTDADGKPVLDAKGKPTRGGPDLYVLAYSKSFDCPIDRVDDNKRQIGKVQELALGFQGGAGAFLNMGAIYGVVMPTDEANAIKDAWRGAHPNVVQLWRSLEDAAFHAVANPGTVASAARGRIKFTSRGGFLWMVLPSKRVLAYASPSIVEKVMPWSDKDGNPVVKRVVGFMGMDDKNKWSQQYGYGGLWTENAVQATARDVMVEAMFRVEAADYRVLMTVHDEVVAEREKGQGSLAEFESLMTVVPDWAAGLPVAAAGWRGPRYKKG